jgi:hypothetical protein
MAASPCLYGAIGPLMPARASRFGENGELMPDETLRISPKYTAKEWRKLNRQKKAHWPEAIAIVRDRLEGRFLKFADMCLKEPYSGFVVLAIDCMLAETIQQFIEGRKHSIDVSGQVFRRFLERSEFQPHFDKNAREAFYDDIRCGLLHQAEAKKKWLIRREQTELLKMVGDGYIIDVERFHAALKASLETYFEELRIRESTDLRGKLWQKMGFICDAREEREPMEALDAAAADTTA